jgi:hypothetical protein
VLLLGKADGIERISEILGSTFTLTSTSPGHGGRGGRGGPVSFQRVALPLVMLLTDPAFVNAPHVAQQGAIYTSVFAQHTFCAQLVQYAVVMCDDADNFTRYASRSNERGVMPGTPVLDRSRIFHLFLICHTQHH